ncbi:unnamed protein product [Trichobilharzia szidati]|nr:unnamed protein product [Trichobilharzia szidati]
MKSIDSLSEYGKSYTYLDSARDEYYDRLKFRIEKRNSEYSHQPFLWEDLENLRLRDPEVSHLGNISCDASENSKDDEIAVDGPVNHPDDAVTDEGDGQEVDEGSINQNKKEVGIQTQRLCLQKTIEQPKAFVPYAIGGSPGPTSGVKRTFNVKSERDVYPSAVRAGIRRRERLMGLDQINSSNSKRSSEVIAPKSRLSKNKTSPLCKTDKKYVRVPQKSAIGTVNTSRLSGSAASYSDLSNNGPQRENTWTSEYIQRYPLYPSSVYVRSASVAAGRCRPLSFSHKRPSSSFPESLVPSTPVLLSCRGSNPAPRSSRATRCDICSFVDPSGKCARPLLRAH